MGNEKLAFELGYSKDGMFLLGGEGIGIETVIDGWNSYVGTINNQLAVIADLREKLQNMRIRSDTFEDKTIDQDVEIDRLKAEIELNNVAIKCLSKFMELKKDHVINIEIDGICDEELENKENAWFQWLREAKQALTKTEEVDG